LNHHHLTTLALAALLLLAAACEKKGPPKPIHTEPWLAHPPASAAASADAGLPLLRYTLGAQSRIDFDVPSKQGALRGSFTHVGGELRVDPSDLSRSRGHIQVDLGSLHLSADGKADAAALLAHAQHALGVGEGQGEASASFDVNALEEVSPAELEPAPEGDAGVPSVRHARATAVGDLLLHGFRVTRRVPLVADFSFTLDRRVPASIVIRSRAPFPVSLETHDIQGSAPESGKHGARSGAAHAREARVTIELYATKLD
jgi:hypothetical protein